jgi:hypothetical protein
MESEQLYRIFEQLHLIDKRELSKSTTKVVKNDIFLIRNLIGSTKEFETVCTLIHNTEKILFLSKRNQLFHKFYYSNLLDIMSIDWNSSEVVENITLSVEENSILYTLSTFLHYFHSVEDFESCNLIQKLQTYITKMYREPVDSEMVLNLLKKSY